MKEITVEQLVEFSKNFNNSSLYQTGDYALTMEKQDFKPLFVGLFENGNIIGATVLLIQKKLGFTYAYAPRGFLIDYNNFDLVAKFTKEIKKFASKKDIVAIKLNPLIVKSVSQNGIVEESNDYDKIYKNLKKLGYYHFGYNTGFEAFKPRFEAIIKLDSSEKMFASMKKEFRTKVRSAIDNGVEIHKGNYNNLEFLYTQAQKKYPRDLLYFQYLYYFFNKNDNVDLFYARFDCNKFLNKFQKLYIKQEEVCLEIDRIIKLNHSPRLMSMKVEADNLLAKYYMQLKNANIMVQKNRDGVIAAACLFIKNNDTVYMIMDGVDRVYRSYNAKHLLIWQAMEYYHEQGFKFLNLGGIVDASNTKYSGLNMFKMNFGSFCYEYIGDLELVCKPSKYFLLKNAIPYENVLKK